ncbi:hypothetical protein Pmar_PMAR022521 [Perkinsus marinus ATCC 50983]|uniref:Uncharacterized protein n=2 Tax=Perkinsus marinus (strain ATCC 50983 / TXsc) TaxID=423536 RepID=C5KNH4_PERM5|nr:hypothetical protein Pmar_PMAR022521 [Perkinsus marinus ATCC 50983]EER13989.1 hypothetical protein Pmar_PMAR022521 [Perkinsus marinus ATCC 50983]|eukprot:XP_002782194.1 hypothetical protein Pmar_PMAR022521 [Perkinsus marinus ATCC 50983]
MFGFAILVSTVAAIMASGVPSGWCEEDHNVFVEEDCYDNLISCDFLPSGGIKMVDYDMTMKGYWDFLISAQNLSTGDYSVFRTTTTLNGVPTGEVMINAKADSIAAASTDYKHDSYAPMYIWAIVDNEIRLYGTPETSDIGLGEYKVLEPASGEHTWTSVSWNQNDDHPYLYAVDSKNNQVYEWDPISDGVETSSKKLVAGNADGKAIDDDMHLYHPQSVRSMQGYLYISQLVTGEEYRIVKWEPSSPTRVFKFNFTINGRFGFDVVHWLYDVYPDSIIYRYGDAAVYVHCVNTPDGEATLLAGGCGAGHGIDQFVNADDGCLRFSFNWGTTIWDYNANPDRFVVWPFPASFTCPTTTTAAATTTTPATTTTTTPATTTACEPVDCIIGDEQCGSYIPGYNHYHKWIDDEYLRCTFDNSV